MRISLPKIDWELISFACIKAAKQPEYLNEDDKRRLEMLYWEIRYRVKNNIKG